MPLPFSQIVSWGRKVGYPAYLWRMAVRQFFKRVLRRDVYFELSSGERVRLPSRSQFSSTVWVCEGRVDDGCEELLLRGHIKGTRFLDVGAHFGYYSLLMRHLSSGVVAFEADPANMAMLQSCVGAYSDIEARPCAVSDEDGELEFLHSEVSAMSRGCAPGEQAGPGETRLRVPCTRLDTCFPDGSPRVGSIKLDVEGHEDRVILGGKQLIRRDLPVLLVETSREKLALYSEFLDSCGYRSLRLGTRLKNKHQERIVADCGQDPAFVSGMVLFLPADRLDGFTQRQLGERLGRRRLWAGNG